MPTLEARLAPCRSSLLGALAGAVESAGQRLTLPELAGLTGLGFAHRASPGLGADGPTCFAWASELGHALHALGHDAEIFHAAAGDPLLGTVRARALAGIERELAAGRAAVVWGVHLPEFGLVRGLHADEKLLLVSGVLDAQGGRQTLAADRLGEEGDAPALFVIAVGARAAVSAETAREVAVERAIRELGGTSSMTGTARGGPGAYALWLEALRSGHFDPAGAAFTLAVAAEARGLAVEWMAGADDAGDAPATAGDAPSIAGDAAWRSAAQAAWRAAGSLASAAARLPFPLPPGTSIDSAVRAELIESLSRARDADEETLRHLRAFLDARRRAEASAYTIGRLGSGDARALFGCLADLPMGGLDESEARCREALRPRLDRDFFALAARAADGAVHGHLYYAPLERSLYPIRADRPALLLFCGWVRRSLRGRGIGPRLVAALREHARALGVAGVLAEATELEVFLPEGAWRSLGFHELEREGPMRLCFLPAADGGAIEAAWIPPAADAPALTVRHAPNCPLLDASRRAAAQAARAAGAPVDEADATGPDAGVAFRGRRLPNLPLPGDAVAALLGGPR